MKKDGNRVKMTTKQEGREGGGGGGGEGVKEETERKNNKTKQNKTKTKQNKQTNKTTTTTTTKRRKKEKKRKRLHTPHLSHCISRLEPLLTQVRSDRKSMALGILDYIKGDTFSYDWQDYLTRYGFDWRLAFFETYFRPDQYGADDTSPKR